MTQLETSVDDHQLKPGESETEGKAQTQKKRSTTDTKQPQLKGRILTVKGKKKSHT